jgi:hypothetical protein
LGFLKGSNSRIAAYGYAYTGNKPIFLGIWSIDTKGQQSRLMTFNMNEIELSINGFKVIQDGVVKPTIVESEQKALKKAENDGACGIVFDLRQNPGGYLDAVLNTLEYLVPVGTELASYEYMDTVYEIFSKKYPKVRTVRQEKHMKQQAREAFLDSFDESNSLKVGFCVLGGSFSEGVDLPGRRLIGVGIVGVGLPGISNERNLLKEYYDDTRESGYDYAYTYPGMNRVLQAAGRVIRRESDCGVIVLMDDRYATPQYQKLFPDHWSHMKYAGNASELANMVADFWSELAQKPKK